MITDYSRPAYWRQFLSHYPAELLGPEAVAPQERWWRWRRHWVHVDRLPNPAAPVKTIFLHGGAGYGRLMLPYARLIGVDAIEAVIPDLPGHGLTRVYGRPIPYDTWIDCVTDLVNAERTRDGRPVILFGVSMGGLLSYSVAFRARIDHIFATSLLDPREPRVRAELSRWPPIGSLANRFAEKTSLMDSMKLPLKWLSDPERVTNSPGLNQMMFRDPWGRSASASWRFLRTYLAARWIVEPELYTGPPVTLLYPGADRLVSLESNLLFFDRLNCSKRLVTLEGAGHIPAEKPGLVQIREEFHRGISDSAQSA